MDDKIYKLDISGKVLDSFNAPGPSPIGLAFVTQVTPPPETGGTDFDDAIVLTDGQTLSGEVVKDEEDYYKFYLDEGQEATVTMQPLDADQDLYIYNPSRVQIDVIGYSGTSIEECTFTADTNGYYYAMVGRFEAGSYTITLSIPGIKVPDGEDVTLNHYTLLESQTIGPDGGTLAVDDFSLIVPPSAFASNVELELSASSEDRPFGDYGVSRTFRVEGLPLDYYQPLQVRIKYQGTLSGESFIAIGEEGFATSLNAVRTGYNLLPATESSGYLICELPASKGNIGIYGKSFKTLNSEQEGKYSITISGVSKGYSTYTSGAGHFEINFPPYRMTEVKELARYLEEAYEKFNAMGFSYKARTKWPISVTCRDIGKEYYGLSGCSKLGDNYGYLEFNSKKMNEYSEMRTAAGHEFFHLVQSLYDPRNRFSKAKFASNHLWLDEATAVWSEEKFTSEPNYHSQICDGHEMAPFNGMQAGAQKNAQDHGYGMSAMIKHLATQHGENIVVSMYDKIKAGKHPVEAVIDSTPKPVYDWWEEFLQKYVSGEIYDDVTIHKLCLDFSRLPNKRLCTFKINDNSDRLKTFSCSYPDLSGKLFVINLNYDDIDSSAAIKFKLVGGGLPGVTVFKYKKTNINVIKYLDYSSEEVTIPNVRALTDEGWNLLVLVTNSRALNPYTDTTELVLEVKVEKPGIDLSQYKYCHILYGVIGTYEDGETKAYTESFDMISGSFSENTYHGSWDKKEYSMFAGETHYVGSIDVTVNHETQMVTVFELHETTTIGTGELYRGTVTKSIRGINVPLLLGLKFEIKGEETKEHIEVLTRTSYLAGTSLTSFTCAGGSYITIIFYKGD